MGDNIMITQNTSSLPDLSPRFAGGRSLKALLIMTILALVTSLTGCLSYRVTKQDMGHTVFMLKKPYFLSEIKMYYLWTIPLGKRYSLCPIGHCSTTMHEFPQNEKEYIGNIKHWQQWNTAGIGYERIPAIIRSGTHYIVLDRYSGTFNSEPYEFVRLLDGPYQDITTYLF